MLANAFYVFVYTMLLKRRTTQNIVWGGLAGCFPALIGWTAVTGELAWTPVVLFLVVFFWTPPHTWALALRYREDYRNVDVPMLPVVKPAAEVGRQVVLYSWVMVATSLLLWPVAGTSLVYPVAAAVLGAVFLVEAHRMWSRAKASEALSRDQPDAALPRLEPLPLAAVRGRRTGSPARSLAHLAGRVWRMRESLEIFLRPLPRVRSVRDLVESLSGAGTGPVPVEHGGSTACLHAYEQRPRARDRMGASPEPAVSRVVTLVLAVGFAVVGVAGAASAHHNTITGTVDVQARVAAGPSPGRSINSETITETITASNRTVGRCPVGTPARLTETSPRADETRPHARDRRPRSRSGSRLQRSTVTLTWSTLRSGNALGQTAGPDLGTNSTAASRSPGRRSFSATSCITVTDASTAPVRPCPSSTTAARATPATATVPAGPWTSTLNPDGSLTVTASPGYSFPNGQTERHLPGADRQQRRLPDAAGRRRRS